MDLDRLFLARHRRLSWCFLDQWFHPCHLYRSLSSRSSWLASSLAASCVTWSFLTCWHISLFFFYFALERAPLNCLMFDTFTKLVSTTPYKVLLSETVETEEWVWNVGGFDFDHLTKPQHSRLGNHSFFLFRYFVRNHNPIVLLTSNQAVLLQVPSLPSFFHSFFL
jgi:hypothetical protein